MLAIIVPTKRMAGVGLFCSTDSARISSRELKPINRITIHTKTPAMMATIGPQKPIMLIITGYLEKKAFHEFGATKKDIA